jgi:short-subunit dehydrogenase
MVRKLDEAVVVITGASSGIGRASALRFAEQGTAVVLAARRQAALQEVAEECQQRGGRALAVPTEVTDAEAVQALAQQAVEHFGRVDVWVNNAAVTLFGRFEETPLEAHKRVIETNTVGYIHGARAALPHFREQGRGVLIQVSSIVAVTAQSYTSAYVMSKAAIRTLSMCLRQELILDGKHDIHVCTVLPSAIDTPVFQQAANYTGRMVQPVPPVYPADRVAQAIVRLAKHPRREVIVGNFGRLVGLASALMPGLAERITTRTIEKKHLSHEAYPPPTPGNLWEPIPEYAQVSGGRRKAR